MKLTRYALLLTLAISLAACASPSSNTASTDTKDAMMSESEAKPNVGGYCPVAYVEAGKPVKGVSEHAVSTDAELYWFVNGDAKALYEKNPDRYQIPYVDLCATGLAMGKKIVADPTIFSIHEGRIYLFSNAEAKAAFDATPVEIVEKADAFYSSMM